MKKIQPTIPLIKDIINLPHARKKEKSNAFKFLIDVIQLPDRIQSQIIFSEIFASQNNSYWLDSSIVLEILKTAQ